ncbi:MAG TPA: hypothetical protein VG432_08315 [Gemmatimonadaceae bacterium]|nr:hypothetical protein [Gemmatimonadaceae bacterium]
MSAAFGRRVSTAAAHAAFALAVASASGCAGHSGSDITVAYRGDVARYRELVRVRIDADHKGRVVVPDFPSTAAPRPIATSGSMQVVVSVKTAGDTVLARDSLPPIDLAPRTSYGVNVVLSTRRPAETRCSGAWRATRLASSATDSLYVSLTAEPRGNPPRCDD